MCVYEYIRFYGFVKLLIGMRSKIDCTFESVIFLLHCEIRFKCTFRSKINPTCYQYCSIDGRLDVRKNQCFSLSAS